MSARDYPIQAVSLLLMICHSDLINFLFCTGQTSAEVDRFVGRLFDKDPFFLCL
jgi:hypothetical protein